MKKSMYSSRPTNRSRAIIRGSSKKASVPLARESRIPAGSYHSVIEKLKAVKTCAGADAVEVIYRLTDTDGNTRHMREVLAFDSWFFEKFCDAMIAAGLEEGADLQEVVGIAEEIVLDYPELGGIGRFERRVPAVPSSSSTLKASSLKSAISVADDAEFDDFLEDDEE